VLVGRWCYLTRENSERIQGGFREDSGRIQGGFREDSGRIQRGFRENSGRIQGGFREDSERIQGGFREFFREVSGRADCVIRILCHFLYSLCFLSVFSLSSLSAYSLQI